MNTILLLVALCAEAPMPSAEERAAAEPVTMAMYMHRTAMRHRIANGLREQRLCDECTAIAQAHANWMAANHNMSHGGGEQIIAMGQPTPEAAMQAWMNSSGHRYWMLSGTTRAGWGCQRSSSGAYYWAGVFRNDPAPVVAGAVANTESSGTINYSNYARRRLFRFRR